MSARTVRSMQKLINKLGVYAQIMADKYEMAAADSELKDAAIKHPKTRVYKKK